MKSEVILSPLGASNYRKHRVVHLLLRIACCIWGASVKEVHMILRGALKRELCSLLLLSLALIKIKLMCLHHLIILKASVQAEAASLGGHSTNWCVLPPLGA